MAEGNFSVIRVEKITAAGAQKNERHNERKNESYADFDKCEATEYHKSRSARR